jgi:hypothetical protein
MGIWTISITGYYLHAFFPLHMPILLVSVLQGMLLGPTKQSVKVSTFSNDIKILKYACLRLLLEEVIMYPVVGNDSNISRAHKALQNHVDAVHNMTCASLVAFMISVVVACKYLLPDGIEAVYLVKYLDLGEICILSSISIPRLWYLYTGRRIFVGFYNVIL